MKPSTIEALQIAIEANVPVLIWGGPGTGKTSAIESLAREQNWQMETVIASIREPADFAGLPVVHDGKVRMAPPDWAERLSQEVLQDDTGLVFFDELSTATPAVQAALLRVVFGRTVGDTVLGKNVRVVAAANEINEAAGGWDLAPPTANRFLHLDWDVDVDIVSSGIAGQWPTATPLTITPDWRDKRPQFAVSVAAFMRTRPGNVHAIPQDDHLAGKAWPSPRSWDAVVDVLTVAENSGCSHDARLKLVTGLVGDGVGAEFLSYLDNLDLPDPEVLLKDPSQFTPFDRDDKTFAVVMSVANAVITNLTKTRWENALKVYIAIEQGGKKDIAGNGVRLIMEHRKDDYALPPELRVFGEMLRAAGLMPKQKGSK